MESRGGVAPPPSIVDGLAARVTRSTILRALCLAWLAPATWLLWVGLAVSGLRAQTADQIAMALDRIQALSLVLAVFTHAVGLLWLLRVVPVRPRPPAGDCRAARWRVDGAAGHALAAALAVAAGTALAAGIGPVRAVAALAAGAAWYAASGAGRLLLATPLASPLPLAALSWATCYRLTAGWSLPAAPGGPLAPLLLAEGLMLAWVSLAAARAVLAGAPADDAIDVVARVDLVSQAPARRSLPEPAVGR